MTWLRVDDKMWRHPKVAALSKTAFKVHVSAMSLCAEWETDGFVSQKHAKEAGATARAIVELTTSVLPGKNPLWIPHENGWVINDFLVYNPSKKDAEEKRAKYHERASLGGKAKAERERQHVLASSAKSMPVSTSKRSASQGVRVNGDGVSSEVKEFSARARNDCWQGLADVFGYSPKGSSERGHWGKLVKELCSMGATRESIHEAARRYRAEMPKVEMTPPALVKHYERLMNGRPKQPVSAAGQTLEIARQLKEAGR